MKKIIKRNILNLKDKNSYPFNWIRVVKWVIILLFIIFIIMFINGAVVDKEIR